MFRVVSLRPVCQVRQRGQCPSTARYRFGSHHGYCCCCNGSQARHLPLPPASSPTLHPQWLKPNGKLAAESLTSSQALIPAEQHRVERIGMKRAGLQHLAQSPPGVTQHLLCPAFYVETSVQQQLQPTTASNKRLPRGKCTQAGHRSRRIVLKAIPSCSGDSDPLKL